MKLLLKILLAALTLLPPAWATECQTFAAGDTNYIAKLNLLAAGCSAPMANGQGIALKSLTELTTIAAAAYTDTTIQIPAGAIVLGVSGYTVATATGPTQFVLGDSGDSSRYTYAPLANTLGASTAGTKAGAYFNQYAVSVRITAQFSTPSDTLGRVRVTIHYLQVTPPTS